MNKCFIGFCAVLWPCITVAQTQQKDTIDIQYLDEVVVSDSRFSLKRENSGKTVILIDSATLERNQGRSVAEIINVQSGIEITGNRGRQGEVLGVFARGGRGRQVLVVIDGIRVSDPASFSQEYDLRLLNTANITSIEIINRVSLSIDDQKQAVTRVFDLTL